MPRNAWQAGSPCRYASVSTMRPVTSRLPKRRTRTLPSKWRASATVSRGTRLRSSGTGSARRGRGTMASTALTGLLKCYSHAPARADYCDPFLPVQVSRHGAPREIDSARGVARGHGERANGRRARERPVSASRRRGSHDLAARAGEPHAARRLAALAPASESAGDSQPAHLRRGDGGDEFLLLLGARPHTARHRGGARVHRTAGGRDGRLAPRDRFRRGSLSRLLGLVALLPMGLGHRALVAGRASHSRSPPARAGRFTSCSAKRRALCTAA